MYSLQEFLEMIQTLVRDGVITVPQTEQEWEEAIAKLGDIKIEQPMVKKDGQDVFLGVPKTGGR